MTTSSTPTIVDYAKYANLQMAAEAILSKASYEGKGLVDALVLGNNRVSQFTTTQAQDFAAHWRVEEQYTSNTGFSGTLFVCTVDDPVTGAKAGEKVLSFRSTEFIDDAARDNYATNQLEIFKSGFAWGQIKDMEEWYAKLKNEGQIASTTWSCSERRMAKSCWTAKSRTWCRPWPASLRLQPGRRRSLPTMSQACNQ